MSKKVKRSISVIIGLLISAFLIWFLFRDINFMALVEVLKEANYLWLIPAVLMVMVTMYQRAYRWHFMVLPIKKVPFSKLLAATCIGFMANNVLPLRLGEFVRAYSLSSQDKEITKSASMATIFVERMIFDLITLLSIFGVIFVLSDTLHNQVNEQVQFGVYVAIGIAIVGVCFMLFLAVHPERVGNLLNKFLFFLPNRITTNLNDFILKFARGLEFLKSYKKASQVGLHSFLIWLQMGFSNLMIFAMFDFDVPIETGLVLLVIVSISIMVPSSPGFVGVYHAGVAWSLSIYGIPKEEALSCALVLHALQYLTITTMGFYYLKKEHLSLKKLEEEAVSEI